MQHEHNYCANPRENEDALLSAIHLERMLARLDDADARLVRDHLEGEELHFSAEWRLRKVVHTLAVLSGAEVWCGGCRSVVPASQCGWNVWANSRKNTPPLRCVTCEAAATRHQRTRVEAWLASADAGEEWPCKVCQEVKSPLDFNATNKSTCAACAKPSKSTRAVVDA